MDIRNRRALKQEASAALAAAPNQKRIIVLYTGISLLLSLVILVLNHFLDTMVADTSGLSNIGTRVILQTVQSTIPLAQLAFTTLWSYGYQAAALKLGRRQYADRQDLMEGFRLVGPIVRLTLLQYAIMTVLTVACLYTGTLLFAFSPLSRSLATAVAALPFDATANPDLLMTDPTIMAAVADSMLPLSVVLLLVYFVLVLPIMYLFRMAAYCLLDHPQAGALSALRESRNMMRRNRLHLLKLDLSFWWYYLLLLLAALICYADLLLPLAGVALPFSETVGTFLFFGLYLVVDFAICYCFRNYLELTYVNAYEALKPKPQTGGIVLGNFQM